MRGKNYKRKMKQRYEEKQETPDEVKGFIKIQM